MNVKTMHDVSSQRVMVKPSQAVPVLVTVVLGLLLAGCDGVFGGKSIATINGSAVSESSFQAYLLLKRIPLDDDQRVASAQQVFLERQALAQAIEDTEVLNEDWVDAELAEFKRQLLISRYFEKTLKEKVNEQAMRNYYASHSAEYETRKAKVSHILIRTNAGMSANEKQALLTRARQVYGEAKTGADFAQLARDYSQDMASAKKGGALGWLVEGAVDPVFSGKIFALENGQISAPFTTALGFHIVRLEDEIQVVKKPYESVKGDIRYRLRQLAKEAETERLMASAPIKLR